MDEGKFERVWRAHSPAVLRYCTYSAGSAQAGEDLAAETFARYLAKGDHVPEDRAEAWLIRVARNLCTSHHRSLSRGERALARAYEAHAPQADGWTDSTEWHYVAQLPERQRLAVYLRVVEERSFPDMARAMGVSAGAAKMIFYRATESLRRKMSHPGLQKESGLERGVERA